MTTLRPARDSIRASWHEAGSIAYSCLIHLEVVAGTTVTWTNQEAVPHTVTAADGGFDSGTLDEEGTFQHTFAETGTFDYVCAIHPSMQASVIVSG